MAQCSSSSSSSSVWDNIVCAAADATHAQQQYAQRLDGKVKGAVQTSMPSVWHHAGHCKAVTCVQASVTRLQFFTEHAPHPMPTQIAFLTSDSCPAVRGRG